MNQKLNTVITALLALAAKAHHWHLTTDSYAEHVAFGDLYNYAHELVDRIAEPARSDYNWKPANGVISVKFSASDQAVSEITNLISQLDTLRDGKSWLVAIVDEGQESLHSTLYKLKFLS